MREVILKTKNTVRKMASNASDELRVPLLGGEDELETVDEEELGGEDGVEVGYRIFDDEGNSVEDRKIGNNGLGKSGARKGAMLTQQGEQTRKKQFSGSEMIVAVFVVAFDTKKGELTLSFRM